MNIVFLTVEERLYLPAFFHRVLAERAADTRALFLCPLKHGNQSTVQMINKYRAAFGWVNLLHLARREFRAGIRDRLNIGRRQGRFHSLASVAKHHRVECEVVTDVNAESFHRRLRDIETDLLVSVSCPQIFKQPLIELPPRGCLNMHGALLPKYRGLAPSFWMMLNGETEAGVTVFLVNRDIDLGDVVEVESFPIRPDETLEQFIIRSKAISADVLLRAIRKVESGACETTPLSKEGGSYHSFPTRADYRAFRRRGRRLW
jgi:methionyl-tRNA formyltransferase